MPVRAPLLDSERGPFDASALFSERTEYGGLRTTPSWVSLRPPRPAGKPSWHSVNNS